MMRRTVLASLALLGAGAAPATAGQLQDLLDEGFRVVGVAPGPQQDPLVFIARDNQLFACRSYVVVRPAAGQSQCTPVR